MKKIFLSLLAGVVLLGTAGVAEAQIYSSNYQYPTYPTTGYGCTVISRDLYLGMSDYVGTGDVSRLQQALANQGYLSTAQVTGYFNQLTFLAVKSYQVSRGLPSTGYVGALTRASLQSQCGGTYNPTYPTYPTYPNYPTYPTYPNYPGYNYAPVLTSLSSTQASVGSSVTIYGSGFDYSNNTVIVDQVRLTGLASYNGTSISFTVPNPRNQYNNYDYNYNNQNCYYSYQYQCNNNNWNNNYNGGTYPVSVTSTRGTSNVLSLIINSSNNGNCYNNNYNNNSYYGNCNNNQNPTLSSISPNSASAGSSVTIYGSGFSQNGNTVHFGSSVVSNVSSYNGSSMMVTVPWMNSNGNNNNNNNCYWNGSSYYCSGNNNQTYSVYVTNDNGYNSNSLSFTSW
jgi:hypothetical protein